jgi:hypothetical protein
VVLAMCGSTLFAIDQHAADERVQLELLQARLAAQLASGGCAPAASARGGGSGTGGGTSSGSGSGRASGSGSGSCASPRVLNKVVLKPGHRLQLTQAEGWALSQHTAAVERWGWRIAPEPGGVSALMTHAPSVCGVTLAGPDLKVGGQPWGTWEGTQGRGDLCWGCWSMLWGAVGMARD